MRKVSQYIKTFRKDYMTLHYVKISDNLLKLFYDEKGYGEFYIRLEDPTKVWGEATLEMKDPDYGHDLIVALAKELMPVVKISKKQFMKEQHLLAPAN